MKQYLLLTVLSMLMFPSLSYAQWVVETNPWTGERTVTGELELHMIPGSAKPDGLAALLPQFGELEVEVNLQRGETTGIGTVTETGSGIQAAGFIHLSFDEEGRVIGAVGGFRVHEAGLSCSLVYADGVTCLECKSAPLKPGDPKDIAFKACDRNFLKHRVRERF